MLEQIKTPDHLKNLSIEELRELSEEIRETIIKTVSCTGGHLASNLGVVELTLALHYVFNSPEDRIVWDVGHQSYTHKLLTGRAERFHTLRQFKGLSGFPKRSESPHDHFGTGHSSTSISAALGIIAGNRMRGKTSNVIAVIGDGAMTAGLAFEGLNNAGHLGLPLIVILNDNEMSISRNVGAISNYLNRILTGDLYKRFKKDTKTILENIPKFGDSMSKFAQKMEETLKGFFLPGQMFEELGFNYIGPIDGHNLNSLIDTFKKIKDPTEPILVHVITKKGKGYEYSEDDPSCFHGVGPFEPDTGEPKGKGAAPSYSKVFGDTLIDLAREHKDIVAIVAAMTEGTGLKDFAEEFPERFFDVGIAEPHAVTFAAGLATEGYLPVVAIYSTFLQRGYDEIIHDVCLQNLPVIFALDRAGLVGDDGPTHHGAFDLSYLRHIPNLTVMAPKDGDEFREMLKFAITLKRPVAIRYPRGRCTEKFDIASTPVEAGQGEIIFEGTDIGIIGIGNTVYPAYLAAKRLISEGVSTTLVNARFVKPLDNDLIRVVAEKTGVIITVEENSASGGFGSAVLEALSDMGLHDLRIRRLGIPDLFVEHGSQRELRALLGLDEEGIYRAAVSLLGLERTVKPDIPK
ncbi:MAG: 1-deoxy-D-xylulose-5-phosphate synthase [Nitrospirae bacterium]|nr:MAG: 1-deoxy-D-xylulose-5-phosphate synthase [Nitrospirota bacterium]